MRHATRAFTVLGALLLGLLTLGTWHASAQQRGTTGTQRKTLGGTSSVQKKQNTQESADRGPAPAAGTGEGKVRKTDAEWRAQLTRDEYYVTRLKGTEPAFTGKYAHGKFRGVFTCVCCGAPLFHASTKFESGTGWPSFWRPVSPSAVTTADDYSNPFEHRIEVNCARCDAHLGHVFPDGPAPTGLRYCINSIALRLAPDLAGESVKSKTARKPPGKSGSAPKDESAAIDDDAQPEKSDDPKSNRATEDAGRKSRADDADGS